MYNSITASNRSTETLRTVSCQHQWHKFSVTTSGGLRFSFFCTNARSSGDFRIASPILASSMYGSSDAERLAFIKKASKGWEGQGEFKFWLDQYQIEGKVPSDVRVNTLLWQFPMANQLPQLTGTFLRNGPGVNQVYGTPLSHPIDGDGMICALTFINGKIHFQSRFVNTATHRAEAQAHSMLYRGQMGTNPNSLSSDIKSFMRCVAARILPFCRNSWCRILGAPHQNFECQPIQMCFIGAIVLLRAMKQVRINSTTAVPNGWSIILTV